MTATLAPRRSSEEIASARPAWQRRLTSDKAARFQHCMVDNENGTVTLSQGRPDGSVATQTVSGDLPGGAVRVVFQDDNYNPDKHFDGSMHPPAGAHLYTWHWDNIQIS